MTAAEPLATAERMTSLMIVDAGDDLWALGKGFQIMIEVGSPFPYSAITSTKFPRNLAFYAPFLLIWGVGLICGLFEIFLQSLTFCVLGAQAPLPYLEALTHSLDDGGIALIPGLSPLALHHHIFRCFFLSPGIFSDKT